MIFHCIYCILFILSICLLMDTLVTFIFWLLWIMLLWTCIYNHLSLISILETIKPEEELLHHMIILCFISFRSHLIVLHSDYTTLHSYHSAFQFYIPHFIYLMHKGCKPSISLPIFVILLLFYNSYPNGCEVVSNYSLNLNFPKD